ncbi:hypothetical protein HYN43_012755 [Mucilaginibacter celer]|uniref:Uncharacterized protein n=1 Tax=Mucilaginibacter celer TaxID=2305508 RepID=A0A494VXY6_9SPHI|nr:hypothetical protein HYN43_012755 [Mucilaginibacter celer]
MGCWLVLGTQRREDAKIVCGLLVSFKCAKRLRRKGFFVRFILIPHSLFGGKCFSVSRKASGESGQNDGGLERGEGHSYFLQKRRVGANAVGQNLAARGSAWFAGQRLRDGARARTVAQRSLPGDLIYSLYYLFFKGTHELVLLGFGSFYQEKEQSLPAAIERANVCWIT